MLCISSCIFFTHGVNYKVCIFLKQRSVLFFYNTCIFLQIRVVWPLEMDVFLLNQSVKGNPFSIENENRKESQKIPLHFDLFSSSYFLVFARSNAFAVNLFCKINIF